jgi:hypothetical protein
MVWAPAEELCSALLEYRQIWPRPEGLADRERRAHDETRCASKSDFDSPNLDGLTVERILTMSGEFRVSGGSRFLT